MLAKLPQGQMHAFTLFSLHQQQQQQHAKASHSAVVTVCVLWYRQMHLRCICNANNAFFFFFFFLVGCVQARPAPRGLVQTTLNAHAQLAMPAHSPQAQSPELPLPARRDKRPADPATLQQQPAAVTIQNKKKKKEERV